VSKSFSFRLIRGIVSYLLGGDDCKFMMTPLLVKVSIVAISTKPFMKTKSQINSDFGIGYVLPYLSFFLTNVPDFHNFS
jgi:hypothetical protein